MTEFYDSISASGGAKKFVSAAAVADHGDSQALYLAPTSRRSAKIIVIGSATLQNRSGGAVSLGLAVRYALDTWFAGQVTAAGVLTDDTTHAQDESTGDFSMHDRADSGSGFLVSCTHRFNILGLVQSAAGDQVSPVLVLEYWNGSSWTDIASSLLINDTLIGASTGEKVLCWPMPLDWAKGGSGTGVSAARYNLRVRHTHSGAGTANPVASQLFVGFAKMALEGINDNGVASLIRDHEFRFPSAGDALFSVFSTASRANMVEVDARVAI